uniref:Uncharacterized protein n=1 Tax=Trieres chinensis TaxID=1514140 RepID=A0A7S2A3K8_TRICV
MNITDIKKPVINSMPMTNIVGDLLSQLAPQHSRSPLIYHTQTDCIQVKLSVRAFLPNAQVTCIQMQLLARPNLIQLCLIRCHINTINTIHSKGLNITLTPHTNQLIGHTAFNSLFHKTSTLFLNNMQIPSNTLKDTIKI